MENNSTISNIPQPATNGTGPSHAGGGEDLGAVPMAGKSQ
jgi:hypothetical protein